MSKLVLSSRIKLICNSFEECVKKFLEKISNNNNISIKELQDIWLLTPSTGEANACSFGTVPKEQKQSRRDMSLVGLGIPSEKERTCSKCKKQLDEKLFFSQTLNQLSDQCNKCRKNGYIRGVNPIPKGYIRDGKSKNKHFIVSKNEKCVLYDDILRVVFDYSNNYTKFQLCNLYGNIFNLSCRCKQKAKYCTISTKSISCDYCHWRLLHKRYEFFYFYCDKCIDYTNYYTEDHGECICNGRRQMYDVPLETIVFNSK